MQRKNTASTPCKIWLMCLAACIQLHATVNAQEHEALSHFTLRQGFGTVELDWQMISGSTCQGIDILRSTNGFDFELVGAIAGLCGHISQPVDLHFTDNAPLEFTTLFYRLNLGSIGSSSIQMIKVDQVISEDQRAYPVPAFDQVSLAFRVPPNTPVDLQVFNASGKLVLDKRGAIGPTLVIPVRSLDAGTYQYQAVASNQTFSGSFLKADQ